MRKSGGHMDSDAFRCCSHCNRAIGRHQFFVLCGACFQITHYPQCAHNCTHPESRKCIECGERLTAPYNVNMDEEHVHPIEALVGRHPFTRMFEEIFYCADCYNRLVKEVFHDYSAGCLMGQSISEERMLMLRESICVLLALPLSLSKFGPSNFHSILQSRCSLIRNVFP